MRIFMTGATGWIGSVVTQNLLDAGHMVCGLARSDASADALQRHGATALRGSLRDLDVLAKGARESEGVIHLGFTHDQDFGAAAELDRHVIGAFGDALAGSGKRFVGTSGTMVLTPGRLGTEDDDADPRSAASFRVPSEELALSLAGRGVRASVVRPAPTVHGDGDHGFVAQLVRIAREKGSSAYVGDGANRWPAVHRLDAARLFTLAAEQGGSGARYHAVGEDGVAFRSIATAIGKGLGVPCVSLTPAQAAEHFGRLAFLIGIDNPASHALTTERLVWRPVHTDLLTDLAGHGYFEAPSSQ